MDSPYSGKMRQRIAFEQRGTAPDAYGNVDGEWVPQFVVWAQVIPRKGGEHVLASRLAGVQVYTIFVRYSQDAASVDVSWRARNVHTGEIYNLRSTDNPDQKHKYVEFLATSGDAT